MWWMQQYSCYSPCRGLQSDFHTVMRHNATITHGGGGGAAARSAFPKSGQRSDTPPLHWVGRFSPQSELIHGILKPHHHNLK